MIQPIYDELVKTLEANKDKTKCYALAMLTHEGHCMTMSNGNPMELCFMTKALDGLYDETVKRAQAMQEAHKIVPLVLPQGPQAVQEPGPGQPA